MREAHKPNGVAKNEKKKKKEKLNKFLKKKFKRYMQLNVHFSTIYNIQGMEATWMPINRWMDKDDCGIYIQ